MFSRKILRLVVCPTSEGIVPCKFFSDKARKKRILGIWKRAVALSIMRKLLKKWPVGISEITLGYCSERDE
jgi:hypothetical protein